MPSAESFFHEAATALRAEGRLLFVEPAGHVTPQLFTRELEAARRCGLFEYDRLTVRRSLAVLLTKQPSAAATVLAGPTRPFTMRTCEFGPRAAHLAVLFLLLPAVLLSYLGKRFRPLLRRPIAQKRSEAIFKQLIEINTTDTPQGNVTTATAAMSQKRFSRRRLRAGGCALARTQSAEAEPRRPHPRRRPACGETGAVSLPHGCGAGAAFGLAYRSF